MSTAIIHFQPIEKYPPVLNALNVFKDKLNSKIYVFTTEQYNSLDNYESVHEKIVIYRLKGVRKEQSKVSRLQLYLNFYLFVITKLFYHKIDKILYYETISALPALLYKKFKRKCKIFVHYHEYVTPQEYIEGMVLIRYNHKLEKRNYSKFEWISHTNEVRLKKFMGDNKHVQFNNVKILPNYPPESWYKPKPVDVPYAKTVKAVYVGALSLATMHTEAFCKWVHDQDGKIEFDIYSYNFTEDVNHFLKELNSPFIKLKNGVNYEQLPEILPNYNVGLILYNGHIPNYIFNAPNKFFEYFACGLDVWYPQEVLGMRLYKNDHSNPKVVELEFSQLTSYKPLTLYNNRKNLEPKQAFFCEDVYMKFVEALDE